MIAENGAAIILLLWLWWDYRHRRAMEPRLEALEARWEALLAELEAEPRASNVLDFRRRVGALQKRIARDRGK